jgi:hypothetical protein
MKLAKNMAYNIEKSKTVKKFCLRIKIKKLEKKRNEEIFSFISANPSRAAKTDNIETEMKSDSFDDVNLKIKAVRRLLLKYSNN